MGIALSEWVHLLRSEYLAEFIPAGGAAVKIAVAAPERAANVLYAVVEEATAQGCFVAYVDAAQTRVHMIDQVFHAVARQIDWDALTDRWLRPRLRDNGIAVAEGQSLQDVDALALANELRRSEIIGQINRLIANAIGQNYALSKEFRTAVSMLCIGHVNPQNVSPTDADMVRQWLRGERTNLTALKRLQIYQRIGRHNARWLLQSLAAWLREVGYAGLALVLDLNAVVADDAPLDNPVRYTRNSVLDTYEVLRQFIDDTDEMVHTLVVAVAGPGLLDNPRRSLDNYTALKLRTSDEVRDRNRANPLNVLVRLDMAGGEGRAGA